MQYYERSDCRFCGYTELYSYLDLGSQPPSNSYIQPSKVASEIRFPLRVSLCKHCSLSQLTGVVSASDIFSDYQYLSSTSGALVRHYQSLTNELCERFSLREESRVVDIGCNDGILLKAYPASVGTKIGVEPSNVYQHAQAAGFKVYNSFFDESLGRRIRREQGGSDVITMTNVFAHIDDIHTVMGGILSLLSETGILVIEAPYVVEMVDKLYFDTIYHEHLCYLGVTSMNQLMEKHGMALFDIERVEVGASGPALRYFCQIKGGTHATKPSVSEFLDNETNWGIRSIETYRRFAQRIEQTKEKLRQLLEKTKMEGARVGAYGAPAKGNTLLNTFGLDTALITEAVAETNHVKQGKLTPGTHLPIISEQEFLDRQPEYALLLSWNYLDFFLEKSEYIKNGGKFIVPLPEPKVCPEPTR